MSSPDRSPSPPPNNTRAPAIADQLIQDQLAVVVSAVGGGSDAPFPLKAENGLGAVHAVPAVADQLNQDQLVVLVGVLGGEGGGVEDPCGRGGSNAPLPLKAENDFGAVPQRLRRRALLRMAFALRVSAAVLCLASFSVIAADDTVGWAGDSFGRYGEYRYLVAVNAMAFVYSAFQISAKVHHAILKNKKKNNNIIRSPTYYYFDLSMDQMLAYLLISASSVSASCNDIWVSRFESDRFRDMANAAIGISFLAFLALALSAIISAFNLFRWSSLGAP